MPRQAKPFIYRGWWITKVGGKATKLAPAAEPWKVAEQIFHELLAKRGSETQAKTYPQLTFGELVDLFLDYVRANKEPATYADYRWSLKDFRKRFKDKRARDLTFLDAEGFKQTLIERGGRPGGTVNHFVNALNACFNWAVDVADLLPSHPFGKLKKLHAEGRQRTLTDEEFAALLRHCTDALFRQVLLALRFTAARPGDLRQLTWSQVDWENHCWVVRNHKTKTTAKVSRPKIVPMIPLVERLLRWRFRKYGQKSPFVFLNSRDQPWTKDALVQRMGGLRRRAGIAADENGEKIVMYTNRHTFLTEAARNRVTGPQLQLLGGWTSLRMAQRYVHLSEQDAYQAALQATRRQSG